MACAAGEPARERQQVQHDNRRRIRFRCQLSDGLGAGINGASGVRGYQVQVLSQLFGAHFWSERNRYLFSVVRSNDYGNIRQGTKLIRWSGEFDGRYRNDLLVGGVVFPHQHNEFRVAVKSSQLVVPDASPNSDTHARANHEPAKIR